MQNRIFTISIVCLCWFPAVGQSYQSDSILIKADSLIRLLNYADTANYHAFWDNDNIDIHGSIVKQLSVILSIPQIVNYNLDSLLQHEFLGITHSEDKRLWIFSWYEKTGGTFKSNVNLVHFRTQSNKPYVSCNYTSDEQKPFFCSRDGQFFHIIKLKSSKDIYLCLGSVGTCSSCCAEIASVVQLTKDSIIFDYPAFSNIRNEHQPDNIDILPCFTLDFRCINIERFEYDPKTQTIYYRYKTDDLTPIFRRDDQKSKTINGRLKWDGIKFVETIK